MNTKPNFVRILGIVCLVLGVASTSATGLVQSDPLDTKVESILASMDARQRVGQLILVTFYGLDTSPDSEIATLITQYHIGGVLLSFQNENFTDGSPLPRQTYNLTTELQRIAANQPVDSTGEAPSTDQEAATFVPLFIAIAQANSGSQSDIFSNLFSAPSNMALGASWDPELANQTGQIVGRNLTAMGINLLLGPSADIVELPQPSTSGDLGTEVFGGEPFWASKMLSAYIAGGHTGSTGKLAIVPVHFPGLGAADRTPAVEVPTVRRSLDQLSQYDLLPFAAVADVTSDPLMRADGFLVGHISFRGFQGENPRVQTRPISLDQQALQALIKIDTFADWRADGGLLISDELGLQGIRTLYAANDKMFPNRRIAQDALLAGNDILYVGNFGTSPRANQTATIIDTIDFLVQLYEKDQAFQARVDDAVARILRKKLQLYSEFDLNQNVLPSPADLASVVELPDVTFRTALRSLTLLSPGQPDFLSSPQVGDSILIFTDSRTFRYCGACVPRPTIGMDALRNAILQLYGPQSSGIVLPDRIMSFDFDELEAYLQGGPVSKPANGISQSSDAIASAIDSADWIVFVTLDADTAITSSLALKQFLAISAADPDVQIVVMAMGAPYYLDSTEIGKLTAFYGLYGTSAPFIEVAARALFLGLAFEGASPVSVASINYNIFEATSPDPSQIITLHVESGKFVSTVTATPPAISVVDQGDTLNLSTGIIRDRNGNPVPDGTPVEFVLGYATDGLSSTVPTTTIDGIAHTSIQLGRSGQLQITVQSNPAHNSDTAQIIISDTGTPVVTVIAPPGLTPTAGSVQEPSTKFAKQSPQVSTQDTPRRRVTFADLFLSLLGLSGISGATYYVGRRRAELNDVLLLCLAAVIFGLIGYNYYALILPGAGSWRKLVGEDWAPTLATLLAGLVGPLLILLTAYARRRWEVWVLTRRGQSRGDEGRDA